MGFNTKAKKMAKKTFKKKITYKRKARPTMALTRAVKNIQQKMDGEKKRQTTFYQEAIGQVSANSDGITVLDVTPAPLQGVQTNQRIGAGIRLHSTNYNFQINQLSNCNARVKVRIWWLAVKGAAYSAATLISQFSDNVFQPNPFIGGANVRDYNCQLNPDYFGTYKVIRTKYFSIEPDTTTPQTTLKSFRVGIKYNKGKGHDIRYNQNLGGLANLFNGQIIMIVQCDRGNDQAVTSTITGISDQSPNTGLFMQYNKVDYYFDN